MSLLIAPWRAFRQSPHFRRFWKFGAVSIISTIVSQTILLIVYPHLLDTAMGSSVVATTLSTVPAYYLNRRWTWGKRGRSHVWKEVMPFWVIALIGLALSTVIVGVAAKNYAHIWAGHKQLVVHIAYLFAYALIWVGRYSILNRFLFGPRTQRPSVGVVQDSEAAEHTTASPATATPVTEPALIPLEPSR